MNKLDSVMSEINKSHGNGSVMFLGNKGYVSVDSIPTGSIGLDLALGIGGFPRGRIIEIYGKESSGKTSICIHAIAEAQKLGGRCAIIDAEHSFDRLYAENLGVNVDELIISQPSTGEEGLEIADKLIGSGEIALIVIDSVAALVPKAELEGEMGDNKIGLHARLMSQALRKITGSVNKTNCVCIFTNQLREKIGVNFGCLHADTLINFTDGRSIPIRKVVENKIQGNVWSFNEKTYKFEENPIIDYHYNGDVGSEFDFIHIQTQSINGKGRFGVTVTPNHEIHTNSGWKQAKDLNELDKLTTKYESIVNNTLGEFLTGKFIGDSSLKIRSKNTASLFFQNELQVEYMNWQIEKIRPFFEIINTGRGYRTNYLYEFAKIKKHIDRRNPLYMLDGRYSDMAMAIWVMDDGHYDEKNSHDRIVISIKRLKGDKNKLSKISSILSSLGYENSYSINDGKIAFTKLGTHNLAKKICAYIPEFMQYKIPKDYRGKYVDFKLTSNREVIVDNVDITLIRSGSKRQLRQKGKYDISIKGNHNYIAGGYKNGILLHNSPDVTTGGNALKYYASIRLDVSRSLSADNQVKDGKDIMGNLTKVKVVKNKVAPPFKTAEFNILYGIGIDKMGEILHYAVELGFIQKSGSWYSYNDAKIGQGKESVAAFLADNPELAKELHGKIIEKIKNVKE